jgi:hypothetical protein
MEVRRLQVGPLKRSLRKCKGLFLFYTPGFAPGTSCSYVVFSQNKNTFNSRQGIIVFQTELAFECSVLFQVEHLYCLLGSK